MSYPAATYGIFMIRIFVGILLLSLAGFCLVEVIARKRKYKHIDHWLFADGEIVDNRSFVEDAESSPIQITTYKYQVMGVQYENTILRNLSNFLGLNTFLGDYQQGDKVQVLYDPNNPHETILSNYNINILYLPLGIGFIAFIVGIISILLSMDI